MPAALLLAVALGQVALAEGPVLSLPKAAQRTPAAAAPSNIIFEFLTSAVGAPALGDVCTVHAGRLVAPYVCQRGDLTNVTGGGDWALTSVGSPSSSSPRHCPNGLDCDTAAHWRATSGNYRRTTNDVPGPAGDFSVCWWGEFDAFVTSYQIAGHTSGSAPNRMWLLETTTSAFRWLVYNAAGSNTTSSSSGPAARALHVACMTYQRVGGAADNVLRSYLDGTETANTATAVLANEAASRWMAIGQGSGNALPSNHHGFLYTSTLLSAPDVLAISTTAFSRLTGKAGEVVTTTRASTSSVTSGDGTTVGWVANNRASVAGGGLRSFPATTNLALRSEEVDNAAWSDSTDGVTAAPTLNGANAAASPDGLATAEDYTFPATTGALYSARSQAGACSVGSGRSISLWLRGVSAGGTADLCVSTAASTYSCTGCAFTTTWARCRLENVTVSSGGGALIVGNFGVGNGNVARDANRVYVWGAQCVAQPIAGPYVSTVGSAVARSADVVTTPMPAALSRTEGCLRLDVTPSWTGNATPSDSYYAALSSTGYLAFSNSSTDNFRTFDGTNSPAVTAAHVAGTTKRYGVTWSATANELKARNLTATTSTTSAFTTLPTLDATLYLGSKSSGATPQARATIGSLILGQTAGACE